MSSVAIVTGYSSGLGYALSEELLERGWSVVGVSRGSRAEALHETYGDRLVQVTGSVASDETVAAAFDAARHLGDIKLVVNCAGLGCFGEIGSYSAADVMQAVEANLAGLILFSDKAAGLMVKTGGDIVNVMSTAAKQLKVAEPVYCAVKWGAKAYTRTLRDALKAKKAPVRVFEIYPCGMKTAFWDVAIRPGTDGQSFPEPGPIAKTVVDAISSDDGSYQLEMTFERG